MSHYRATYLVIFLASLVGFTPHFHAVFNWTIRCRVCYTTCCPASANTEPLESTLLIGKYLRSGQMTPHLWEVLMHYTQTISLKPISKVLFEIHMGCDDEYQPEDYGRLFPESWLRAGTNWGVCSRLRCFNSSLCLIIRDTASQIRSGKQLLRWEKHLFLYTQEAHEKLKSNWARNEISVGVNRLN